MKKYTTLILLIISLFSFGQTEYLIDGFSEKYIGKLNIEAGQEDEVFKKGAISISLKSSKKEIIKIESEELTFELNEGGEVKTNVLELQYGEQSLIISQDFNFDGVKDLAIMDGYFSCYHGPSFQIYLEVNNELKHSPEFTRLAQEYCGMFGVDNETKTIKTMTKSGCCWHQSSTFKLVNNVPKPILIIEDSFLDYPYYTSKIIEWVNGKENITIEKSFNIEDKDVIELLSFKLVKSQKKVVLFSVNNRGLSYVLLKSKNIVEFNFPPNDIDEVSNFEINEAENQLTFKNKKASYQIYERRKAGVVYAIGVLVIVDGKEYDLKGELSSVKGSLSAIPKEKLENVDSGRF